VTQGVTHRNEIERAIRKWKVLTLTLHQLNGATLPVFLQHSTAGIDTGQAARRQPQIERCLRHQPGARGDIQHSHTRLETGPAEGHFAVGAARAERQGGGNAIVVLRRPVKQARHECRAAFAPFIKLRQILVGPKRRLEHRRATRRLIR
jgi:hypothetical protein